MTRSRSVVTTRRADDDIDAAISFYIEADARDAALAFIDALRGVRDALSAYPTIGSTRWAAELSIPELRDVALDRFPYVIFYSHDADAVRIHRVLHTGRDIPTELR